MIKKVYRPAVLLVLDGFGLAPPGPGNAVELARKPNFKRLWKNYPHTELCASSECVGLSDDQSGNSEAGHMNIGAGRVVLQDGLIIDRAIEDKTFYSNFTLTNAVDHVRANKSRLHIMGMLSDGNSPHSCLTHLLALIRWSKLQKVDKVFLHLFTDGRDAPQRSVNRLLDTFLNEAARINNGPRNFEIVSLIGRFYAMDRGKNWSRTEAAYKCLTSNHTVHFSDYHEAIEHSYNLGLTDEYLVPSIINSSRPGFEKSRIHNNDAVIFFNLRSDRARQLTKAFVQKDFNRRNPDSFTRRLVLKNLFFCDLTGFGPDLAQSVGTAFPGAEMIGTLPFMMNSYRQLYIAETEKFAHVTYFINGGYPDPVFGETRVRIPSPVVDSYKDKPEMAAYKITEYVLRQIKNKKYDFIVINLANPDMVGHTGDLPATIKAVEHVDVCLGKIDKAVRAHRGTLFVTADHGNAEMMIIPETGETHNSHTTNPVPFIIVNSLRKDVKLQKGNLGDIAPTIYDFLDVPTISQHVTGQSLIKHKKIVYGSKKTACSYRA